MNINKLKFDEKGLIPAVIQDFFTKEVLTVAYMNKESLEITLDEKMTCFYSRSRQKLWRKGETSGNTQRVVSIVSDCDNDALVINVIKKGPACHLGNESCFSNVVLNDSDVKQFTLRNLYELIEERKTTMPKGSYTTYLFEKGMEKILKKVGEESTEVVIAAMKEDKEETLYEISDLCYHLLVLMVEMNISVSDIKEELFSRSIIDYKVKQETCGGKNEK